MKTLQLYADGIKPDKSLIENLISQGIVGCTINPTLAKGQCVYLPFSEEDALAMGMYERYSKFLINNFYPLPVSVQVLSSDIDTMEKEAYIISSWGDNVYVKIPIVNESGESCAPLIVKLLNEGIKVNVTAIFTEEQVYGLMVAGLHSNHDCILSVFCGRIADTGRMPNATIGRIRNLMGLQEKGNIKLLWAGVRSAIDIEFAREHCDIITLPQAVLDKLPMNGKDMDEYCLETVQMFSNDAKNFTI